PVRSTSSAPAATAKSSSARRWTPTTPPSRPASGASTSASRSKTSPAPTAADRPPFFTLAVVGVVEHRPPQGVTARTVVRPEDLALCLRARLVVSAPWRATGHLSYTPEG